MELSEKEPPSRRRRMCLTLFMGQAVGPPRGEEVEKAVRGFLASKECSYVFVPLVFVALGVMSNWLGRRDNDPAPWRNELAVGRSVVVMTTGKIVSDLCAPNALVAFLTASAFAGFIAIIAFSVVDRHLSWERVDGQVTNRKNLWMGILVPDLFALLLFGIYQYYVKVKLMSPP